MLRPSRPRPFYLCSFLPRGPFSAAMSSSPGRKTVEEVEEEEGRALGPGAPAKTLLLRFHGLKTKSKNVYLGDAELCSVLQEMWRGGRDRFSVLPVPSNNLFIFPSVHTHAHTCMHASKLTPPVLKPPNKGGGEGGEDGQPTPTDIKQASKGLVMRTI